METRQRRLVKARRLRGMTMVELLMVAAVMGFIFSIIPNLIRQTSDFFRQSMSRAEGYRDARNMVVIMSQEIQIARRTSIVITAAPADAPPYSRIAFTNVDGVAVVIFWRDRQVILSKNGQESVLARNVRNLVFSLPEPSWTVGSVVDMTVSVDRAISGGRTKSINTQLQRINLMN